MGRSEEGACKNRCLMLSRRFIEKACAFFHTQVEPLDLASALGAPSSAKSL